MLVTIPIYVELRREDGRTIHRCRPVFFQGPQGDDPHLGLAMSKLNRQLKAYLDGLGAGARHDGLAECLFAPDLSTHLLKLTLDLRERQARCKFLWISFDALGSRAAFTPSLPGLWCQVQRGESLESRVREVLTKHFREQEKRLRKSGEGEVPESVSMEGQAWITTVDVEVKTRQAQEKETVKKLSALFAEGPVDGARELQRVGRCLDWLYPDELHAAVGRLCEVDRLDRLLAGADNRPVVILGPRSAGKTTVLHECVRRRVARRGKPYAARQNVWLLAPGRLISGMTYVGQWEGRVQAILRTARKRKHVLYFDDFLGLYEAGISRDAKLSIADLLKPFILRREIRVLAEMTPEAWQALQDRDRGLADQFHVLTIDALSEAATREILLEVHRELENTHRSRFDLEALPTILDLSRSYLRDAAFPGKAAAFSRQLAQKYAAKPITRSDVHLEFHVRTGLALGLLDERRPLDRAEIIRRLQGKVVGQAEAVEAAADVVAVAKARLNDPTRPLATYLFLGPTGVGKTQCAKALAEVMFSDERRLLRFDMNEFVTPHAAACLVGTFGEPEGLLTSAVRRRPFSVVLFDEIEKAHPDVFDLLLQVLGEGRLTDALGRTADFSNTVIVMTSNLGLKEGRHSIGLAPSAAETDRAYVKAAERFFRPEFFNRIDRLIPFHTLERDEMRRIADILLADVFRRDGLVRRRCALAVEKEAMERIVDAGYHPQFGARALKRSIERQLVEPVAATLSGVKPELPAVVRVYPRPDGVAAVVEPLESVPESESGLFAELEPADQVGRVRRFVNRLRDEIEAARPRTTVSSDGISAEQLRHYALVEQLRLVREHTDRIDEALRSASSGRRGPEFSPKTPAGKTVIRAKTRSVPRRRILRDIQSAHDIHDYLQETTAQSDRPEETTARLDSLREEAALANLLHISSSTPDRALLLVDSLVRDDRQWEYRLVEALGEFFKQLDYGCRRLACGVDGIVRQSLLVSGPGVWSLARAEAGVHVYCRRHENLQPIQVSVLPATDDDDRQMKQWYSARRRWLADLAAGRAATADDPCPLGAIVRFYDEGGAVLDLRTGRSLPRFPSAAEWKSLVLGGLPLPAEMEVL